MDRTAQVLGLLREVGLPLDDDDISDRIGMNRHYVNQVCRRLAADGLIQREPGPTGKLVNRLGAIGEPESVGLPSPAPPSRAEAPRRLRRHDRARRNVDALIGGFDRYLAQFEQSNAFPGPSLYFHERALARRRAHNNAAALMDDELFFEYLYAVLPAWGMHRMGKQPAKVGDFTEMVESFRSALRGIEALWDRRIVEVHPEQADEVAASVWEVIAALKVSTSGTKIVAGSKALHHVLPDLVPPIDRQYTFRFFTGQMSLAHGDRRAFLEWFPLLCEIGCARRAEIDAALIRGGFMATGPAKVIDNAIMGFMQLSDGGDDAA